MRRALLVWFVACVLPGCASTQSTEQRRQVSQCLAQCKPDTAPPGPYDYNAGTRDQRSDGEKRCQSK